MVTRRRLLAGSSLAFGGVAAPPLWEGPLWAAPVEITQMSALTLSSAIRSRAVSCEEVMSAYLKRIHHVNPKFNALVSMRPDDELMLDAKSADGELSRGRYRGWMHGFPHAVKDLADAEGLITTRGSPIFRNNLAKSDSLHIAPIRAAGAIVVGKTNVPEFGLGSQTYNRVFGPSLNPYDGVSTPGGSSGGAAAALALQLVPVADGGDFMGSLRNPGAFCNVIGFRPTPGRVAGPRGFAEQFAVSGPMGRTVSDTARLLATMAGPHPDSPSTLPDDPAQFALPLERGWKGTKIGWLGDFDGYLATEPGVLALCEKALGGFQTLGCEVAPAKVDFSMAELWQTWLTFRHSANRSRGLALYNDPVTRSQLKPELIWEIEGSEGITVDDVTRASAARAGWYAAVVKAFQQHDFLVVPTAQVFPFPATTHWPKEINGRTMDTYHRWMEVVIPGTLCGCPVANVPAGFGRAGLPMGLQIIGPRYADFATLQLSYAYEQATGWNLRHPPKLES